MVNQRFNHYISSLIAAEINRFSKYYESALQVLPIKDGTNEVFDNVVCDAKAVLNDISELSPLEDTARRVLVLDGNFNHDEDIQKLLNEMYPKM